jgi:glycosyltransferase involved in cell wall biosynthesis
MAGQTTASREDEPSVRVLHIITGLYTGGAETMLLRLIERSRTHGLEHAVIALLAGGALGPRLAEAGIPVAEVGTGPRAPLRVAHWIRTWHPTVCQGWMYHGNLAALAGRMLSGRRVPVGWGIHHCPEPALSTETRSARTLIRVGGPLSRLTRAIVYCSRASIGVHEKLGYDPARTVLIPNGFDCEVLHPRADAGLMLRRELGLTASTVLIGNVARYHPMKDHANLIRAFARLGASPGARGARPATPVHLVLIGRGLNPGNVALGEQIRAAGVAERVSLLGERADVPTLIAGLDALAVSSAWGEAFPLVIGEAMSSGVPCVTTDLGDAAWMVGETGIVVPPRDDAALEGGLRRMVERAPEERRRLGAAARQRILDHFALPDVVERYVEVFHEIAEVGARQVRVGA